MKTVWMAMFLLLGNALACQAFGASQTAPVSGADESPEPTLGHVTLVAAPQMLRFGDMSVEGMTYNGNYSGPLIRATPGKPLHVHLINRLSQITNLHFHGILSSPLGHGDNMMAYVKPGQSYDYEIEVPAYQTPGLYWYHAHVHGQASSDVNAGLSGPLLVTDEDASSPPQDRVLVLKEYKVDRQMNGIAPNRAHDNILTINGAINTTLNSPIGDNRRWYVGNLSANKAFQLSIDGHSFTILGHDGVPLLHPVMVDRLDVDVASRYTFLINGSQAGDFAIRGSDDDGDGRTGGSRSRRGRREQRKPENSMENADSVVLGVLHVSGSASTAASALALGSLANKPMPPDLSSSHIDAHRLVVFGQHGGSYTINGQTFDPMRVDIRVPLGNTEEWTIRNDTNDVHVFHIHQVTFQVMRINGLDEAFNGAVDTVRVLPQSNVTIRIAFTHPEIVGRFMFHCHILEHEDGGMMAQIEVYDPKKESIPSDMRMGSTSMHPQESILP